jgi:hypothetical protein
MKPAIEFKFNSKIYIQACNWASEYKVIVKTANKAVHRKETKVTKA